MKHKTSVSMRIWLGRMLVAIRRLLLRSNLERIFSFGYRSDNPQRQLLAGYAAYALSGTLLLLLPCCHTEPAPLVDHLFTAVSALSTTGLSTVDIATGYTFWGQAVILLLIQLGGLGYMTFTSYVMFRLTHHLGTDQARMFHSQFSFPEKKASSRMVGHIVNFSLLFEALGIALLYPYLLLSGVESPLWSAVFHTISAFCTAGFSIYSDNLVQFQSDLYVNIVIMLLSYTGAIGFIVAADIARKLRSLSYHISFTTKVILSITCLQTLWGTLHLFFFEPSLQQMAPTNRLLAALFQSMSAITTVGFNTVDISSMLPISLLILSFSMYIGASPSGTGGGLKSTTLSALFAYTKNKLGLRRDITLAGNKVPAYRVDAALTTVCFYTFLLCLGIYLMVLMEGGRVDFLDIVFEATSALATAGLSSGVLPSVTTGSKAVLILLMYIGRVGVLTLGHVMLARAQEPHPVRRNDLVV